MTIIQPNKNTRAFMTMLLSCSPLVILGVLWLVAIYNHTVNLEHAVSNARLHYEEIQAANAEYENRFFTLFGTKNLEQFAAERGLIKEKQPVYFEISEQWAFASQ